MIEMNPRVSRSSALASKATGFPIAKIAAKLAIGYRLDEIPNDITKVTPASFEPTLDYVVVKVPRFAFEKFPAADVRLTTTMKSVGEAMAIGRNYSTALQKALRSLEKRGQQLPLGRRARRQGRAARDRDHPDGRSHRHRAAGHARRVPPSTRSSRRRASTRGSSTRSRSSTRSPTTSPVRGRTRRRDALRPRRITASATCRSPQLRGAHRGRRARDALELGVRPVFKTVDTCAGEFPALTPYHYSSYDLETEVTPSDRRKVVILGFGSEPHRPGHRVRLLLRARVVRAAPTPATRRS